MSVSNDSTELSPAEALFNEYLTVLACESAPKYGFRELVEGHPEHAKELQALHQTWQIVEALGSRPTALDSSVVKESMLGERYSVVGEIGRGGMGVVYRARDKHLGREVAFKVQRGGAAKLRPALPLQEDSSAELVGDLEVDRGSERFFAEARISAQLDHPGVVPLHELGRDEAGRPFFTMRYVEGQTLHEVFQLCAAGDNLWSRTRVLGVLARVCETMAFAHSRGVVHRDLKPKNIMVGRFGEVYVMDWGVAKLMEDEGAGDRDSALETSDDDSQDFQRLGKGEEPDSNPISAAALLTAVGTVIGTPAYMAPEQAEGAAQADPRADVYAMGAILYELLCGQHPYQDRPSGTTTLAALKTGEPTPLDECTTDVAPELLAICRQAMSRDPAQRYGGAGELRGDLSAFLEQRVVQAYRTGFWSQWTKWYARHRRQAQALLAGSLIAVMGVSAAFVVQRNKNAELQGKNVQLDNALEQARLRGYAANVSSAQLLLEAGDSAAAEVRLEQCLPEMRGWEWQYLAERLDSSLGPMEVVTKVPTAIDLAPDESFLVYGTRNGNLDVHSLETGESSFIMKSKRGSVCAVKLDPLVPERVISGHRDGYLLEWSTLAQKETARHRLGRVMWDLEFAEDGRLAVAADDNLYVFGPGAKASDPPALTFVADQKLVRSVSWGADGNWLATTGQDGTLAVWDANNGDEFVRLNVSSLEPHGRKRSAATFNSDSSFLAAAFPTGSWAVFDTQDWTQVLGGQSDHSLHAVSFRDDDRLLLGGWDTLQTWDLSTRERSRKWLGARNNVIDLVFGKNQLFVLETDRSIRRFPLDELRDDVFHGHLEDITAISVQPTGDWVASASRDGTARVWELASGRCLARFESGEVIRDSVGWIDDNTVALGLGDGSVVAWGLEDDSVAPLWNFGKRPARSLCVSPSGRWLAAVDFRGSLQVWDRKEEVVRADLPAVKFWSKPCFSKDSGRLASVSPSGLTIDIWNTSDWSLAQQLEGGHTRRMVSVQFSNDGTRLVSAGIDSQLVLWDLQDHTTRSFVGHSRNLHDAVFFENDTRIASGGIGREIKIWDVESGESLLTLFGHESWVLDLDVASKTRAIVSSSSDRTLRVWTPYAPW